MQMTTLILVEHNNQNMADATLAVVTAAGKLGEVHALVAGENCRGVAEQVAKVAGVAKVLCASDAAYGHALAENVAPLAVKLMADYDAFLAPATTTGKNIAPRVAAGLDVMQISDILSVEGPKSFTRPIYAGNAIATVESSDAKLVITVRGTAFEKAAAEGGSARIEDVAGTGDAGKSSFVGEEIAKSDRPELTSAKIIVSGGRAFGGGIVSVHVNVKWGIPALSRRERRSLAIYRCRCNGIAHISADWHAIHRMRRISTSRST